MAIWKKASMGTVEVW